MLIAFLVKINGGKKTTVTSNKAISGGYGYGV